jgi:hypothetical protein
MGRKTSLQTGARAGATSLAKIVFSPSDLKTILLPKNFPVPLPYGFASTPGAQRFPGSELTQFV